MKFTIIVAGTIACVLFNPGLLLAACSNAAANSKAQEFGVLLKQKMSTKPDEMSDLASEFGDVMTAASNGVTEQTCVRLDALVKKAKAL